MAVAVAVAVVVCWWARSETRRGSGVRAAAVVLVGYRMRACEVIV